MRKFALIGSLVVLASALWAAEGLRRGKRVHLFNGINLKGWIEGGGEWTVQRRWLIGKHKDGTPPCLICEKLLPAWYDLSLKAKCTAGYLTLSLDIAEKPGEGYVFAVGWQHNRELRILRKGEKKPRLTVPFSCIAGQTYQLEVRTRAAQVEFLLDGKSLLVVQEAIPSEQHWRLTLSTHRQAGSSLAFSEVLMTSYTDPFARKR